MYTVTIDKTSYNKSMSLNNEQRNNPLHGVNLETLLTELVNHYGFSILAEYTNINCFKNRATLESSLKFLKKTEWAREKMERFYLYNYKNLPKASDDQYEVPPRQRIIPAHQQPKEPKVLIEGEAPAPKVRNTTSNTTPAYKKRQNNHVNKDKPNRSNDNSSSADPWANSPK